MQFETIQESTTKKPIKDTKQGTSQHKSINMGNLLYTIAVILVILWAIGYLGFAAGNIIHILLVIAAIAVLFRLIQGRRV